MANHTFNSDSGQDIDLSNEHMLSDEARLLEFHPVWVATKAEREALETAFMEEFFGSNVDSNLQSLYEHMKQYLHTFVFDHRGDDVHEGENRWKYLTKIWKTDLGEYGLVECLHVFKYGDQAVSGGA